MPMIVTAGILIQDGRILICQRRQGSWGEYKWEFPGGKVEDEEAPQESLRRELKEELAVDPEIGPLLCRLRHRYPDREVELYVFHILSYTGEVRNTQFESIRWATRQELLRFDFLDADQILVERLARGELVGEDR